MSRLDAEKNKWEKYKPLAYAFVIGLFLGPFISNLLGWQVTSGTVEHKVRAALIEKQAKFCVAQVRALGVDTTGFEYSALKDIAEKWSVMPGQDKADYDVTYACSEMLGVR